MTHQMFKLKPKSFGARVENGVNGDACDKGRVDLTQHVNMDYFIALYMYINKYVVYYLN
jgi:hypothetical protein